MKYILALVLFMLSFNSLAANPVVGKIRILHTNTSSSSNPQAVEYTEIQLTGVSFEAPCSWLHLKPEDKQALSVLLTAQAQDRDVKVYYRPDVPAPWGAGSCAIGAVVLFEN